MIKTSFKLSKKLLKKAKRYAIDHDKSENDIFTEALAEFLSIREEGETNWTPSVMKKVGDNYNHEEKETRGTYY